MTQKILSRSYLEVFHWNITSLVEEVSLTEELVGMEKMCVCVCTHICGSVFRCIWECACV